MQGQSNLIEPPRRCSRKKKKRKRLILVLPSPVLTSPDLVLTRPIPTTTTHRKQRCRRPGRQAAPSSFSPSSYHHHRPSSSVLLLPHLRHASHASATTSPSPCPQTAIVAEERTPLSSVFSNLTNCASSESLASKDSQSKKRPKSGTALARGVPLVVSATKSQRQDNPRHR